MGQLVARGIEFFPYAVAYRREIRPVPAGSGDFWPNVFVINCYKSIAFLATILTTSALVAGGGRIQPQQVPTKTTLGMVLSSISVIVLDFLSSFLPQG